MKTVYYFSLRRILENNGIPYALVKNIHWGANFYHDIWKVVMMINRTKKFVKQYYDLDSRYVSKEDIGEKVEKVLPKFYLN